MAKKFVTEEGLSQVVDAVVDAIKKVSDKQITAETVNTTVDKKIAESNLGQIEENVSTLEGKVNDCVRSSELGGKIEEAIGVANIEPIKEKIKTLNGRVPKANEGSGDTHTGETSSNTEERPIMVAPTEPI